MWSKSFDKDKNYILRKVQQDFKTDLERRAVLKVIDNFLRIENPLGLVDDLVLELNKKENVNYKFIDEFYTLASDIYRFINPSNQLEFIWDGKSHAEKYTEEWTEAFLSLIDDLAYHSSFNRVVLKGSVLYTDQNNDLLKGVLSKILFKKFNVKKTTKGLKRKVA